MSTYTTAGKEQQADQMEGIQFPTEKDVLLGT